MKNRLAAVVGILVALAGGLALAIPAELRVGPVTAGSAAQIISRGGTEGQQIVGDISGRFFEAGRTNQMFVASTGAAGTTVVAANATPPAAAAATILTLSNPAGSGKLLEVERVLVNSVSGTPGAGGLWLAISTGNGTITGTSTAPVSMSGGPSSVARSYVQTAITGGLVHVTMRPIAGCTPFAGAIAATSVSLNCIDVVDGSIVLQPGSMLTIADAAIGTTWLLNGSIEYREAPIP